MHSRAVARHVFAWIPAYAGTTGIECPQIQGKRDPNLRRSGGGQSLGISRAVAHRVFAWIPAYAGTTGIECPQIQGKRDPNLRRSGEGRGPGLCAHVRHVLDLAYAGTTMYLSLAKLKAQG